MSGRLILLLATRLMERHGWCWSKALAEAARILRKAA